jgi:hypothetical protein
MFGLGSVVILLEMIDCKNFFESSLANAWLYVHVCLVLAKMRRCMIGRM